MQLHPFLQNGRSLLLALDQGLEHGPKDFTVQNIDPDYVLNIAWKGKYNGMILQKGLAEKYYENYRQLVPLILKLNGKTNIPKIDPYSPLNCSVKRAVELGAAAVGYTIYFGSPMEPKIFEEFSKIQEEAHDYSLPVIAWMYPRGPFVQNEADTDILAYAARTALELGADYVKMKYNHDKEGFKWVVKCAGKVKVMIAGGEKTDVKSLLQETKDILDAGCVGMAIGRNVWQSDKPLQITSALKKVIFENKSVDEAMKEL